jgi:hypothetical protein
MLLALATLALAPIPKSARAAAPLPVKLEFRAEEGCPNEQEFLRRLASRAEFRLVDDAQALRLRVTLDSAGNEARGELRAGAEDATDAREVEARSCSEVADALALIAALMIERTKREQAAQAPPVAPPAPAPSSPAPPTRAATPGRQLELGLAAIATRPMAATPLTGVGVSLFVAGSLTWWLSAQYSRNDVLVSPAAARFGFGGLVLGVGPPALQLGPRVQLAAALAAEGAFVTAEGVNVDVKSSARRSYWAAGALARMQWRVASHAGLFLELGGFVPVIERRFSTREPYELVGRTSGFAPQGALGFALSL